MKGLRRLFALAMSGALLASGLGFNADGILTTMNAQAANIEDAVDEAIDAAETPDVDVYGNYYRSELTNEWTSMDLRYQRPIAVMVDNEKTALPHYGVNQADIVYEMVNSTHNDRITRLMCIVKDWEKITQFGNVRSTRPTNVMLAGEYNAILLHDGGPYHIYGYLAKSYNTNLSGGFARFSNGKATEFTEYITYNNYTNPNTGVTYLGLDSRINNAGISRTYTKASCANKHFLFAENEFSMDAAWCSRPANSIELPFPHNKSKLVYNAVTKTYDYYEYDMAHVDPLDGNKVTTFKNVIILKTELQELDSQGYMLYNICKKYDLGLYLTNGRCIPILWSKLGEDLKTYYLAFDGQKFVVLPMNTGKTYIGIVPSDSVQNIVIN